VVLEWIDRRAGAGEAGDDVGGVAPIAADKEAMAHGAGVERGDEVGLDLAAVMFAILGGGAARDEIAGGERGWDRAAVHGFDACGVIIIGKPREAHREVVV
jgi:hypothetical protein